MENKRHIKSENLGRIAAIAVLIVIFILLGKFFSANFESMNNFLKKTPVIYSSLAFVVLYILSNFVVFWDVKDLLKPVAAVIFGAYISTLLIYIAEIINACIFFSLSRVLGREFVERMIKGKFNKFYEKLSNINFGWIFLLRLIPLIPYRVLDASFGLSKVSFRKYMFAVVLASPPRIFWIQFIMASIGGLSMEKMIEYFQKNGNVFIFVLLYFVAAIFVAFKMKKKFK